MRIIRCKTGDENEEEMNSQRDFFLSKEEQLLSWSKQKRVFSKAEIIAYGTENYYLRADRTIRDFVSRGLVRRVDKAECIRRNLKGNMAWYEFVMTQPCKEVF